MFKSCSSCNSNISFWEYYITGVFRGYYKYICPKCGAKYKSTKQSILIYLLIVFPPGILLLRLYESGYVFLWLIISVMILQPLILKFKKI